MSAFAPVLEGFFTDRLTALRASPHTVAAYRDTYRLLLRYTQTTTGKAPASLDMADVDHTLIAGFLDHLETDRHNSVTTRNLRLAAIHALFRYAALRCPEHAALIARVLAIPVKRADRRMIDYLTPQETAPLLAAPNQNTPRGQRDYLLIAVAIQTGLRLSELTGATRGDLVLGTGAHIRCTGKGRKERATPLTKDLARQLSRWLAQRDAAPDDPLFPAASGSPMSADAVDRMLTKHVASTTAACPSLAGKRITPHTLRHTCAMNLLHAGIDTSSIALWLGHATTRTTDIYLHANMEQKEKALALVAPPTKGNKTRYQPTDRLLAFLESL
jgi:integrase/recombinase XerD